MPLPWDNLAPRPQVWSSLWGMRTCWAEQGSGNEVWPWPRGGTCLTSRAGFRDPRGAAWDFRVGQGSLTAETGTGRTVISQQLRWERLPLTKHFACVDTCHRGYPSF